MKIAMNKIKSLEAIFVTAIPEKLEAGKIYASIDYATVAHLCCCGCGREVVTPLSPTDWKLTYDGETISLHPSIGNWSFPCRSHYWVRNGAIRWAADMSSEEIQAGRNRDRRAKQRQFGASNSTEKKPKLVAERTTGFWHRLRMLLSR